MACNRGVLSDDGEDFASFSPLGKGFYGGLVAFFPSLPFQFFQAFGWREIIESLEVDMGGGFVCS